MAINRLHVICYFLYSLQVLYCTSDVFLQGLIEGPSAVPSYHSLDAVDDEAAELPDLPQDVIVQQPGGSLPSPMSSNPVIAMLFQFVTDQSYIGMLIIMMVSLCNFAFFVLC